MNYLKFFLLVCLLLGSVALVHGSLQTSTVGTEYLQDPATATPEADKLVYADFETATDNRPVSSRGGFVQVTSYEENATLKSSFKGPELVRTSKDSPNRALSFDYKLVAPNQWAGVGLEIHGQPDKDGKTVADDVSAYKYLMLQAYATGVTSLRIEFMSRGQGINVTNGYPQMTFKVSPGFNTYKVPFKSLVQPQWAEPRVATKDVLKKLTAISVAAYCGPCTPVAGTVVVDNLVFQN
ncbi:MAG: hypothetical protein ND895_12390 [Pyrinomonadaceae bacterium]|nr:hypothetical protein [Pyrinomonadaceae bacterium]